MHCLLLKHPRFLGVLCNNHDPDVQNKENSECTVACNTVGAEGEEQSELHNEENEDVQSDREKEKHTVDDEGDESDEDDEADDEPPEALGMLKAYNAI